MMDRMTLQNGSPLPKIGFGTFGSDHYSPAQVAKAASCAIEAGYRMFDCAQVYGNENVIGEVFESAFKRGTLRRGDIFVTSKVWNDRHGAGKPTAALKQTLSDLRLDYVDAYFIHWPFPNFHAPGCDGDSRNPDSVPFSPDAYLRVWRELETLYDAGLTRSVGMSNMTISKLEAVLPHLRIQPALIEMELHPSFQQTALFDYCVNNSIQVIGFCPLGSPNRPERDRTPADVSDMELPEVQQIARARSLHPAQICLMWAVARGAIPIPFSGNEKNIAANLHCVSDTLTEDEMTILEKAERGCRLVKGQVFLWPGAKHWEELWD
jgi:alcohol dehydrogenase (NADP+)